MKKIFFSYSSLLATLALCGGCVQPKYPSYVMESWCFKSKPVMALVPMLNSSNDCLPWDVSSELTDRVLEHLICVDDILLAPLSSCSDAVACLPQNVCYTPDLSYFTSFSPSAFVVVTELLEHEIHPYTPELASTCQYKIRSHLCREILVMSVRLRVVDIRCPSAPRLVSQEVVESNHMIPREYACVDYSCIDPESNVYLKTFMCSAHAKFATSLSERIKNIILCNR